MADTQEAPQPAVTPQAPGSVREAQEALLSLMEPEEEKPKAEEAAPTEEEESTEETQDEALEEESEEDPEIEEDEEEPEESDEGEDEEPELYAVTVNGEEREVSFDELLKGYSRQSDYTKKTQELAEERRNIEAGMEKYNSELAGLQQERQQYVDALTQVIQSSTAGLETYANVDWASLKEEDPIEYISKRDEYREMQERVRSQQHTMQIEQQKQAAQMQEVKKQLLHDEHSKLVEKVPEWGQPESQKAMAIEIRDYALEQGFSTEEISSLIDHRSLVVLMKAQKYDAMKKADVKSKKIKNKPKVVRSGVGTKKTHEGKTKRNAQMKRLKESGNVKDASVLFEDFVELE